MDLIFNDWKDILRNETTQKSFLKFFVTMTRAVGKEKTSKNFPTTKSTLLNCMYGFRESWEKNITI